MELYNYDKTCDCIQVSKKQEEERLRDLKEYFEYLKDEMSEVIDEISGINCFR